MNGHGTASRWTGASGASQIVLTVGRMDMRDLRACARAVVCLGIAFGTSGCVSILETNRQQLLVDSVGLLFGAEHGGAPAIRVQYWWPSCTASPKVTVVRAEKVLFVQAYAERESSCLFASSVLKSHRVPMGNLPLGPLTVRVRQPDGETEIRILTTGPDN